MCQNLGTLQPNYNVHKYWDATKNPTSFSIWDRWKSSDLSVMLGVPILKNFRVCGVEILWFIEDDILMHFNFGIHDMPWLQRVKKI